MRFWGALGFLLGSMAAHGQHLVFTMMTHPNCPVVITSVAPSKDFGFQSVMMTNDSPKAISAVDVKVVFATARAEEESVDGGHVYATIESGERKSVDLFLGRISALKQRAKELKLDVARAIVLVEAVEFSDGTRWDPGVLIGPAGEPSPREFPK